MNSANICPLLYQNLTESLWLDVLLDLIRNEETKQLKWMWVQQNVPRQAHLFCMVFFSFAGDSKVEKVRREKEGPRKEVLQEKAGREKEVSQKKAGQEKVVPQEKEDRRKQVVLEREGPRKEGEKVAQGEGQEGTEEGKEVGTGEEDGVEHDEKRNPLSNQQK